MTLSDRQHDAFDNPAKMACRSGNLRVLREAAYLLWQDGDRTRLRCDWCESMGETGLLTLDLLEREGVLSPGGFVGIDLDPARIDNLIEVVPERGVGGLSFYPFAPNALRKSARLLGTAVFGSSLPSNSSER